MKSAGPTNAATAGALASFEKELKRRKKQKRNEVTALLVTCVPLVVRTVH